MSKPTDKKECGLHNDISNPPRHRLTSRKPLWSDMIPVDTHERWHEDWQTACVVNKRWGLTDSDFCDCDEVQTMSHIVNARPQTNFDGALNRADMDAVDWLNKFHP